MRHAYLALLGGSLMALGIAAIALREPVAGGPPGASVAARIVPVTHPAAPRATEVPVPYIPSTPCVSPFEVVASSLPATLGAAPARGSVTVRVAPLPAGEHAFDLLVMVDIGIVGGSLAPSGPEVTGFLAGRARPTPGAGETLTFDVTIPAASDPVQVDGVSRGSRWDTVIAAPRLGPPVLKGTSMQDGRVHRIDTNGIPHCVTTP